MRLFEANFDETDFENNTFNKVCSVNTLYFWKNPQYTAKKIREILKPNGKLILAFADIEYLKNRKLDDNLFGLYSKEDVRKLLINAGFAENVSIESRQKGNTAFHCAVAVK